MPDISPTMPAVGELSTTADPKVLAALQSLVATVNALTTSNFADDAVTADKLAAVVAAAAGLNETSATRRGKCIIATEETRNNAAYGKLTTPDQVSSVVLPTDGLLLVGYQARWKENSGVGLSAARAAIFMGANQLKSATSLDPSVPIAHEAIMGPANNAGTYRTLATGSWGLATAAQTGASTYGGDVTTGQLLGAHDNDSIGATGLRSGGFCVIFAAAGTYDVSVQFKGDVSVRDRKLWALSLGFD